MSCTLTNEQKQLYKESKKYFWKNKGQLLSYKFNRHFNGFVAFMSRAAIIGADLWYFSNSGGNIDSEGFIFMAIFTFITFKVIKRLHKNYINCFAEESEYHCIEAMHDYAMELPNNYWKDFRKVNVSKLRDKAEKLAKYKEEYDYHEENKVNYVTLFLKTFFGSLIQYKVQSTSSSYSGSSSSSSSSRNNYSSNSDYDRQRRENEAYYQRKRLQNEADWYDRKAKNFTNTYDRQNYQNKAAYARNRASRY